MKITHSNPVLQRNGVKKALFDAFLIYFNYFATPAYLKLTAM
jgi:hypothetical protein